MPCYWLPLLGERAGVRGERHRERSQEGGVFLAPAREAMSPATAHERPMPCYWLPLLGERAGVRYYAPAGRNCGPLTVKLVGVYLTSFPESSYREH
jgi:hypothetical protein